MVKGCLQNPSCVKVRLGQLPLNLVKQVMCQLVFLTSTPFYPLGDTIYDP